MHAKAETISELPSFADSFAKRRCLDPADSFIELKNVGPPGAGNSPSARPMERRPQSWRHVAPRSVRGVLSGMATAITSNAISATAVSARKAVP